MARYLIIVALSLQILKSVYSECANACNGHGKCTSYDMCICNRNWQANDCSDRICPFGLAHVDTPKVYYNIILFISSLINIKINRVILTCLEP